MDATKWLAAAACVLMLVSPLTPPAFGGATGDAAQSLTVYPIGKVVKKDGRTFIVIDKQFEPGLLGMDRLSHVTVIYWFDRNDTPKQRSILQVHPRGDEKNPLTGVFATHSPVRPNLIGVSRCRIISVKDTIIEIDNIDALDGSPVIDLKS